MNYSVSRPESPEEGHPDLCRRPELLVLTEPVQRAFTLHLHKMHSRQHSSFGLLGPLVPSFGVLLFLAF